MTTPAENKIRFLALRSATLQGYFGSGPFRWFDRQVQPGYMPSVRGAAAAGGGSSCLRNRRISTINDYIMTGPSTLEKIRFQLDVLDLDPDTCKAATFAVMDFIGTINLVTGQQFGSPVTTPRQWPNFVSNMRSGLEPQPGPPIYVESIDLIVFNETTN